MVWAFEVAGRGSFALHLACRLAQRDEQAQGRLLALHVALERGDVGARHVRTALDLHDHLLGLVLAHLDVEQAVDAAVRALAPALVRLGVHQTAGPELELVLVAFGQISGRRDVGGRATHVEGDAGEGVLQAPLDQAHRQVRDVDADPAAVQLLRRMHRGATAAEGVEHDIAFVAAGGDDAFEQGDGFLGGVAEAFVAGRVDLVDVISNVAHGNALELVAVPLDLRKATARGPVDLSLVVELVESLDSELPMSAASAWVQSPPRFPR